MRINLPDAPYVTLQLYKKGEIYKVVGPLAVTAVPGKGDDIRVNLGEEIYTGRVELVKWDWVFCDGDNSPSVTVYVATED